MKSKYQKSSSPYRNTQPALTGKIHHFLHKHIGSVKTTFIATFIATNDWRNSIQLSDIPYSNDFIHLDRSISH